MEAFAEEKTEVRLARMYAGSRAGRYWAEQAALQKRVIESTELALRRGLMHDSTEAYLGDVISPLKACVSGYKKIERAWSEEIASRFFVPLWWEGATGDLVHAADMAALELERHDLLEHGPGFGWWGQRERPLGFGQIKPWSQPDACISFLSTFCELSP